MKFQIDHDYHMHSYLSPCTGDRRFEQTLEKMLAYGVKNGLKRIFVTDHYWDDTVPSMLDGYPSQNFALLSKALPLPQAEECEFLFGCETDMDKNGLLGIPKERYDDFQFIIVPLNHLHFAFACDPTKKSVEYLAKIMEERFDTLMDMDLPFHKMGIAHLTDRLMYHEKKDGYLEVAEAISDDTWARLFKRAAEKGIGIELNIVLNDLVDAERAKKIARPYLIAKEQGCKFYLGSDSHLPHEFDIAVERFTRVVDLLGLEESDKFHIKGL